MRIAPEVLETLEFHRTLAPFRERLTGELGERALDTLPLLDTFDHLVQRTELLREWMDMVDTQGEIQWNAAAPIVTPSFEAARHSGILDGGELLGVRALLSSAKNVREGLASAVSSPSPVGTGTAMGATGGRGTFAAPDAIGSNGGTVKRPALDALRRRLRDFTPELELLNVLEDSGRLKDSASPRLFEIRGKLDSLKHAGRRTAQHLFEEPKIQNMLQERNLTWRDGKFLLLVRQEYINRFPGLAVERSSSGNSVYMEPRLLSSINNNLMMTTRDEHDEERRILLEITRKILDREGAIAEAERVLGDLDLFRACDTLIRVKGWVLPELTRAREISLIGARHPMLRDAAVPVDVYCGGAETGFNSLVVTGPNTGGKTVVLKTVGVLLAMAWSGLPLPARDGTKIGTFDVLYADIGDEQSIEQNLSTFSAHLKKIIAILANKNGATNRSVVLLDELGAGTDPQEGAALGVAILETLRQRGCLTFATTHHNPIKQYALTTRGVQTASMEFDSEKLAPTYRLLMGVPGHSNALMIARRYGMPEDVLKLAQGALDDREVSAEDLMSELNERRAALVQAERKFQEDVREAERLKQAYKDRVAEIDLQRDRIMEAADHRAERLIRQAEAASKGMLRDVEDSVKMAANRGLNARRKEILNIRNGMDSRHKKRTEREIQNKRPAEFVVEPGMTVQVAGSGIVGLVESVNKGRATLTAGPMHLDVEVSKLIATDRKAKVATPPPEVTQNQMLHHETVPPSIMVRGMNVSEAMPLVENYLDRAYRAGLLSALVIHGRGEGILRREVHALCERLKKRYIQDFRLGGEGEGGFGVTIVTFKHP